MTPTFRYNPAVVAQTFATMACLAPGRVMLGVGTGEALNEVAVGSVGEGEWPEFKERFARLREAVRLMRELWTQDRVTFEGEYYRTDGRRRSTTAPTSRCRSTSPPAARWSPATPAASATASSAPRARGWSCTPTSWCRRSTRGSTRPNARHDEIDRMIEVKLSWDPDPERALENTRFWAPLSLTAEQKHSIHGPAEMERPPTSCPSSRWRSAGSWPLDPEEVVEALKVYTDLGFDHLVVHGPGHDQERFLSTFAEQVLPGLRELTPAAR